MKFIGKISLSIAASCLILSGCSQMQKAPPRATTVAKKITTPISKSIPKWVNNPALKYSYAASHCVTSSSNYNTDRATAIKAGVDRLSEQITAKLGAMDTALTEKNSGAGDSLPTLAFGKASGPAIEFALGSARPIRQENVLMNGREHLCVLTAISPTYTKELFANVVSASGARLSVEQTTALKTVFIPDYADN